jgi:hypothetical protein
LLITLKYPKYKYNYYVYKNLPGIIL